MGVGMQIRKIGFWTTLLLWSAWAALAQPASISQFNGLPKDQQARLLKQLQQQNSTSVVSRSDELEASSQPLIQERQSQPEGEQMGVERDQTSQKSNKEPGVEGDESDIEVGVQSKTLEKFGYDLFAGAPSTFAPVTEIPVPTNYVIGPGDQVIIRLVGKESSRYELTVDRNGEIALENQAPIAVAGLTFEQLKGELEARISEASIGATPSISMGRLRSIRVFVLGEAYRPGSYTVSSLSTITNALFVSGGVSDIASLRNIKLKRLGKTVATLDLYDLLLKGDTSSDARLLPGDVIFIPPVEKRVSVSGEVRRPAVYEIKGEKSIDQVVAMAGGLLPSSFPEASRLERIISTGKRVVLDIDLTKAYGLKHDLSAGDHLVIPKVLDRVEQAVFISGHVERPGKMAWTEGMRVSDAITEYSDLRSRPDLHYALLKRETVKERNWVFHSLDIDHVLRNPSSAKNIRLKPRDEVIVFSVDEPRDRILKKYISELRQQARLGDIADVVNVYGNVRFPGSYPYTSGMTLGHVINASFDFLKNTESHALLKRINKAERIIDVELVSLEDRAYPIKPGDELFVLDRSESRSDLIGKLIEELRQQTRKGAPEQIVRIGGDVPFPGEYPLTRQMKLSELITLAGGLNESSFMAEAEITRLTTDYLTESDWSFIRVGLEEALNDSQKDISLVGKDYIKINRIPDWREVRYIMLQGEFKFPGRYALDENESLASVVERAGGFTESADLKGAFFTRASLKEQEAEHIENLQKQLRSDIAAASLQQQQSGDQAALNMSQAQSLLTQLENAEPVGRLVIDLDTIVRGKSATPLVLKDGDMLLLPKKREEITVIGEVQQPTSHLYRKRPSLKNYIEMSGGLSYRADKKRIYVVGVDGLVKVPSGRFFGSIGRVDIEPGDTIVVPLDAERMPKLTLWTQATQLIYQLAVAAAAIGSL
jgi:polysaccharide export outer membrane protein